MKGHTMFGRMRRRVRLFCSAVALAVLLVCLGGCGIDEPAQTDAPEIPKSAIHPGTNTEAVLMPDGFRNLVFTCHHTTGLYVTSRGWNQYGTKDFPSLPSDVTAVPNHPMCVGQ